MANLAINHKTYAKENESGCVTPAQGPVGTTGAETGQSQQKAQETQVMAHVGKPAPDFEATALVGGQFTKVKLSDYKGQWVVLCFYPGDFTFV